VIDSAIKETPERQDFWRRRDWEEQSRYEKPVEEAFLQPEDWQKQGLSCNEAFLRRREQKEYEEERQAKQRWEKEFDTGNHLRSLLRTPHGGGRKNCSRKDIRRKYSSRYI
jgi:hypothetical protein